MGLDEYNGTRCGVPRHPQKIIEPEPPQSV
jgi:hypothetical protein